MAVPPLDHGIGRARIGRVRLEQADRQRNVVDDVQHRGDHDESPIEPVADIDVLGLALDDGAEEHRAVGDPDNGQQNCQRPFQFGVFLGGGVAHGQRDQGADDHGLPTPEGEGRQAIGDQPGLAGALHHVVAGAEQCTAAKGEDHQVGVQWAQAAEAGPGQVQVELRPHELRGDEDAQAHADDPPDHRHDGELADDLVVISSRTDCSAHSQVPRFYVLVGRNRHQYRKPPGLPQRNFGTPTRVQPCSTVARSERGMPWIVHK